MATRAMLVPRSFNKATTKIQAANSITMVRMRMTSRKLSKLAWEEVGLTNPHLKTWLEAMEMKQLSANCSSR